MVLNVFRDDMKWMCDNAHTTKAELSRKLNINRASFESRINATVINKGFVEACEALGYDLEVIYIDSRDSANHVLNDFREDFKLLCDQEGTTKADVARKLGISKQSIYNRISMNIVSKGFVEASNLCGYDIQIHYIKR